MDGIKILSKEHKFRIPISIKFKNLQSDIFNSMTNLFVSKVKIAPKEYCVCLGCFCDLFEGCSQLFLSFISMGASAFKM